jgi:hypothetical protein
MERTKFKDILPKNNRMFYSEQDEPIVLSKFLLDRLLKENEFANLIALYIFYYYTAKWQKTNQPKATMNYVSQGLDWSGEKTKRIKKKLKELGLIEDVVSKMNSGKIEGHYIKVHFIWGVNHTTSLASSGKFPPVVNLGVNALSTNNINALSPFKLFSDNPPIINGSITPKLFDTFWNIYPKKIGKGKAFTAWNKICNKSTKDKPSWNTIKTVLIAQKKSERWVEQYEYIPHASTWLNEFRWLDNPDELKKVIINNKSNKPLYKDDDNNTRYWLRNDGYYYTKKGTMFIE